MGGQSLQHSTSAQTPEIRTRNGNNKDRRAQSRGLIKAQLAEPVQFFAITDIEGSPYF
jgi:hypothetical protein